VNVPILAPMILFLKRKSLPRDALVAVALLAALVVVYSPALHGQFLWDDDTYISANATLQAPGGLWAIWLDPHATCQYYPLSFTFFWAIYHINGLDPFWFHLVTLLLHGTAAILFWQLLARLRVRGALLAAVIFALHPVNVMSVAWMTELKNTLSLTLALGAACAYVRFAGLGVDELENESAVAASRQTAWGFYALSLGLFQLAMLAKTAVSFLPVTLLLILWWQRERISRRDLVLLSPMLGICMGMGAFTIYIEQHAGAAGQDFTIGFLDRILVSGRSFWFYLGKLAWPSRLTFIYPRWSLDAGRWWQWLYPAATVAALVGAWLARKRIGKGLFVGLMHFYVSTSMLVLAIVLYMMRYSFVADHWQYYGSLGICALVACGITRAIDGLGTWARPTEIGLGIALAMGLGALTWAQSGMYSNLDTLWDTTLARNPDCWMAHNNLGSMLLDRGQTQEAINHFMESIRLKPDDPVAHADLGIALSRQGLDAQAIAQCREALRLDPDNVFADNGLGTILFYRGRVAEAIELFRAALSVNPADAEAHNNLANALFQQRRPEEAIAEYRAAIQLNPAYLDAHYNLGMILLRQGQARDAAAEFAAALQLNPNDATAHSNLGLALYHQGLAADAIAQYLEALRLDPGLAEAHKDLGIALLGQGDDAGAIGETQKAMELNPADVQAESNLAWMLAAAPQTSLRDGERAVRLATQALQAAGGGKPMILRTLAAAYAQAARFPDAVATAKKALDLAEAQSNPRLAGILRTEMALYEAGRPFQNSQ